MFRLHIHPHLECFGYCARENETYIFNSSIVHTYFFLCRYVCIHNTIYVCIYVLHNIERYYILESEKFLLFLVPRDSLVHWGSKQARYLCPAGFLDTTRLHPGRIFLDFFIYIFCCLFVCLLVWTPSYL